MIRNYLLTAWKVFMRRKLFTLINLLCIVITLLVLMVIASLLETAFRPSGVEGRSERFLQVYAIRMESADHTSRSNSPLGYKLIDKYVKPMPGVERVAALTMPAAVSVYQGGSVSELQMRRVDADYWKILDFRLLAGRLLTPADDAAGRMVVVLNATSARRLFPGQPQAAIGQRIDAGGQLFEVVGVVEDAMHLNAYADIWAPISTFASSEYRNQLTGMFTALVLAHRTGDLPRIREQVAAIAKGVVADDPKQWPTIFFWADSKLDLFARILLGNDDKPDPGSGKLIAMVAGAMLVFMLLPALNLVNLNTGRILERRAEIGVRKAFGATSGQLAVQLIVENVLLSLAGGLLALAATAAVLSWIEGAGLIPYLKVDLNLAVFGWGMLIATVFGLLSGVLPALKMSRLDPVHALKGAN
ncbi:FtsX-like permease family protein [Massilia sp. Dwa41.01b]|uniref:ABC transporter permease n=1 Tax=unclassified Massilia TaxID=2609279 RepID=UPI001601524C|nr:MULTISPECIES: ABC transporter permease [unclassified Massilia]QNA89641.1 FtsX-like permease family protein [Massilia sp. Dwa41.01b]QNB00542.1 FtsX-like permease family protein [Massilia sp. Se16.2.3]